MDSRRVKVTVLLLSLSFCALLLNTPSTSEAKPSSAEQDALALSYRAFNQLASIYRAGGEAPELVTKLNSALGLIQEAQAKSASGDNVSAAQLVNEAQSILSGVVDGIPSAQQTAMQQTTTRFYLVVGSIPIIVLLTTFAFYAVLRIWRWSEKTKLYEMQIVEKETED